MKRAEHPRRRLGVLAMVGLLMIAAIPVGTAVAGPGKDSGRLEATLEHVSDLLSRLEGELAALERPAAERLEERIEGAIEAIEGLIDMLERPRGDLNVEAWKLRIIEIDLRLHRLVQVLEELVESTARAPQRPDAEETIDDLRVRLDSMIMEASIGMSPEEYEQLEASVYRTAHLLGRRIADMAKRVEPKTGLPLLARLVERLEELLFRLDGFILQHFPKR